MPSCQRLVRLLIVGVSCWSLIGSVGLATDVQLAAQPTVSPDGKRIVFAWRGDLWNVGIGGGRARQLTFHEANESQPKFSPDGRQLAFISDRTGSNQVFVMPASGGEATQLTFHTEGYELRQWYPSGDQLLVQAQRDHFWRHTDRLFRISNQPQTGETLLFDAAADSASLAADGQRIALVREGTQWWRQGYRGSQAAQLWLFDPNNNDSQLTPLIQEEYAARDPQWLNEDQLLYVSERSGVFQLWVRHLSSGEDHQLTTFETGVIWEPAVSADQHTVVFRQGFDLWSMDLSNADAAAKRLRITVRDDAAPDPWVRQVLNQASAVAFTDDALEIAFVAGGDLWVMDTELREPMRITTGAAPESEPIFSADRERILFVSEAEGRCDIWQAKRSEPARPWWLNQRFELSRLTDDTAAESNLRLSPDGKLLGYVKGLGELWIHPLDGTTPPHRLINSWNTPSFDWSPDSLWLTYALSDDDFNRDVFVVDVAGTQEPFNISRHPDNEGDPVWSPDGKIIAFTGRRQGDETDVHFVYLTREQDQVTERDRRLQAAVEKFEKERGAGSASPVKPAAEPPATPATPTVTPPVEPVDPASPTPPATEPPATEPPATEPPATEPPATEPTATEPPATEPPATEPPVADPNAPTQDPAPATPAAEPTPPKDEPKKETIEPIKIDFTDLPQRIRTVSIPDSSEGRLLWSADSKTLAFFARISGREGIYTIEPAKSLEPTLLTETTGSNARWLPKGNRIAWLVNGTPATFDTGSKKSESFPFSARHEYDRSDKFRTAFVLAWREMRDSFYDGALNHRNWDDIRRRYEPQAAAAVDERELAVVVNLMLGELNGSHLGFSVRGPGGGGPGGGRGAGGADAAPRTWNETTAHLGVRFDTSFAGPGLKIRDVILNGPADREVSRLAPGEVIRAINGVEVDPAMDLTKVLNGPLELPRVLRVAGLDGNERSVELRPFSYAAARSALYDQWVRQNEQKVDQLSDGRLGYLHIQGMNESSFLKFEQQLYAVGAGRDGLVIDVRENGGGSTADHLLTALTQPVHALTVPRGGGIGYPQDRKIYATWNKPIIVLCNQNSFSNAEIFAHAIQVLNRGRVVGVPTAGGVISTGATSILDIGTLRRPFRGWFRVTDGEDMELNGAVPDLVLWPAPTDWPAGIDTQLEQAVVLLQEDVATWKAQPRPELRRASDRRAE